MKPVAIGLLAVFLVVAPQALFGQAKITLATPDFKLSGPGKPPIGILGLQLGTFAVIEGTEHQPTMTNGGNDFAVEVVNGKKLEHVVKIKTDGPLTQKLQKDKRYVLHGYEAGTWGGSPGVRLPPGETYEAQAIFSFFHSFVITSIEKENDVTLPDARLLSPHVPLAEPQGKLRPPAEPPVGMTGLPLGTFCILEVHYSGSLRSYTIDEVNGVRPPSARQLFVPDIDPSKPGKAWTLHGFEAGGWAGYPQLPESEYSGKEPRQAFQFFPDFQTTSPPVPQTR